tara:strand:+ start:565 stop:681 length:117 start_codon:yes stop_codon:yes gene_type:complete
MKKEAIGNKKEKKKLAKCKIGLIQEIGSQSLLPHVYDE